jgi:hypothetical protein
MKQRRKRSFVDETRRIDRWIEREEMMMIDKPTNHAGKETLYIACPGPAPEGHRTFLPIVPMGLTACRMERSRCSSVES